VCVLAKAFVAIKTFRGKPKDEEVLHFDFILGSVSLCFIAQFGAGVVCWTFCTIEAFHSGGPIFLRQSGHMSLSSEPSYLQSSSVGGITTGSSYGDTSWVEDTTLSHISQIQTFV
jgi:hypothetical protein